MAMKTIDEFLLTEKITVGQAREWMKAKDNAARDNLIQLIHHRFQNRYIKHLHKIDSGFLKMAVCCLVIEALESFRQGEKDTNAKGVGKRMFHDFFKTEAKLFSEFMDISPDFYKSIRCGILHQAETTNAWRILRKGDLLDKSERTINATKFVIAVEQSLNNYVDSLKQNDFGSEIWQKALLKLEFVCEDCKVSS